MDETQRASVLRASPLARELGDAEVAVLARLIEVRDLKDGEVLLDAGVADDKLHVVVSGAIDVAKHEAGGENSVLHTLIAGDLVGELSFMDGEPRFAALVAAGPTRVFSLSRHDFETLIPTHPQIVYKTMRTIMRTVHAIQRRLSMQMVELQNYIYKIHGKY
jgi:CRP-like cAMP-binding protein